MIKFKAAYSSGTGKLLDMKSSICGGVTPQVAIDAIGDALARTIHHVAAACGEGANPARLLAEIFGKAGDIYPTLPEITEAMRAAAEKHNSEPDPEPNYRSTPSGDDQQTLTAGVVIRANGFAVFESGVSTEAVDFDELPLATAGMVGATTAHILTGATAPADVLSCEGEALEMFKAVWAANMPIGKMQRQAMAEMAHQRRMARLIGGELIEEN